MTELTDSVISVILTVLNELVQLKLDEVKRLIQINYRDPQPIYEQIKNGFRRLILIGVLRPGEKIPSVRELAGSLTINPNTIQRAYRELEQEGYICSVPGKGSFVSDWNEAAALRRRELLDRFLMTAAELETLGVSREEQIAWIKGGAEHD